VSLASYDLGSYTNPSLAMNPKQNMELLDPSPEFNPLVARFTNNSVSFMTS